MSGPRAGREILLLIAIWVAVAGIVTLVALALR